MKLLSLTVSDVCIGVFIVALTYGQTSTALHIPSTITRAHTMEPTRAAQISTTFPSITLAWKKAPQNPASFSMYPANAKRGPTTPRFFLTAPLAFSLLHVRSNTDSNSPACLSDLRSYIYFTLASPNNTLTTNANENPPLYYISTYWTLTYRTTLHNTLFNDPTPSPQCPSGHCLSTRLPNSPFVLREVTNPTPIANTTTEDTCAAATPLRSITKHAVKIADMGCVAPTTTRCASTLLPRSDTTMLLDALESRIRTTYPTAEITLVCVFSLGVAAVAYVLAKMVACVCARRRLRRKMARAV
ncbi:hypothetical protein ACN47E_007006 [Coniothyrium glycines]